MSEYTNRISDGAFVPASPITSRFVSPWDTSGWYSVEPDFAVGAKIYSNCDARVKSAPEVLFGADYIRTFNSAADGFDDKQEVDFYTERECDIYVAINENIPTPVCLADFARAEGEITLESGAVYVLYRKKYAKGALVHIDGFAGEGYDHFFVLAVPAEGEEKKPLPETPACRAFPPAYIPREYRRYYSEVFNEGIPEELETVGEVTLRERADDPRDKYAAVSKGCIICEMPDFGRRVVISAKITPAEKNGKYMTCAVYGKSGVIACIVFDMGEIYAASREKSVRIGDFEAGKDYSVRLVFDRDAAEIDAWLGCRRAAAALPVSETDARGVKFIAHIGELGVDNLLIEDDTEIYAVNEDFAEESDFVTTGENAKAEIEAYPFAADKSLTLSANNGGSASLAYAFPAIAGVLTVETKVKVMGEGFALAPEITDDKGNVALRIALYKNNLYATNGDKWERIYGGLNEWMYYPCANWTNLKITLDTVRGVYTLMADGAVRAEDFAFASKIDSACRLAYSCEDKLCINRIRIYDAPDFCRIAPTGKIFDVRDYGAVGDGKTLDTAAIQKAVYAAEYTGGTVYIGSGTYLSGQIEMRSDMTLFVDRDATLLGTQDHGEYPLREPGTSLCAVRQLGRGLIYGENIKNIRITGGGMLDGNGLYRFKMNDPVSDRRALDARPDIVYITYSKDITIENINFKNSAFWTVVPLSSGNIVMHHLNLDCMNTPNRDGIDPVDCHDMTIYSCNIMAGDDGLCFKSSDPVGCYNIDVWDMMIQSLASGIKFGTDTYYCLKNAHISDCAIKNVNRCGISLETVDGAEVENVTFERIDMTDVGAPVYITVGARNRLPRGGAPVRKSGIKNVTFRDMRFDRAYPFSYTKNIREVMAVGQSPEQIMENILFENCDFTLAGGFSEIPGCPRPIDNRYPEYDRHGLSAGHGFTVRYAKNFALENVNITLEAPDVRPLIACFDCEEK